VIGNPPFKAEDLHIAVAMMHLLPIADGYSITFPPQTSSSSSVRGSFHSELGKWS
jgi:hypothetical protein